MLHGPERANFIAALESPDTNARVFSAIGDDLKRAVSSIAKNGVSTPDDALIVRAFVTVSGGDAGGKLEWSDSVASAKIALSRMQESRMRQHVLAGLKASDVDGESYRQMARSIGSRSIDVDQNGIIDAAERENFRKGIDADFAGKEGAEKERAEREKVLARILEYNFDVAHDFGFEIQTGDVRTVYESLDRHNPSVGSVDHSDRLAALVQEHRNERSDLNLNPDSELTTPRLIAMLLDYAKANPSALEKLGIADIRQLTPKQAAMLAGLVVMDKLEYDDAQAISPDDERGYI